MVAAAHRYPALNASSSSRAAAAVLLPAHLLRALLLVLRAESADGAALALGWLVGVVLINVGVGPAV
jgi:hypothetical protein